MGSRVRACGGISEIPYLASLFSRFLSRIAMRRIPMIPSESRSLQRQSIRNHIRTLRRQLTAWQQTQASSSLMNRLLADARIAAANHLALFLSFDGELDTRPLIEAFWQLGKQVYLPVLHPFSPGHLLFQRYDADTPLHKNRLRIDEPKLDATRLLPLSRLEILFTPLVAF